MLATDDQCLQIRHVLGDIVVSTEGVRNAWVMCASRIRSASSAPPTMPGGTMCIVDPAAMAIRISRTDASKLGEAMCIVWLSGVMPYWVTCWAPKSARPR